MPFTLVAGFLLTPKRERAQAEREISPNGTGSLPSAVVVQFYTALNLTLCAQNSLCKCESLVQQRALCLRAAASCQTRQQRASQHVAR